MAKEWTDARLKSFIISGLRAASRRYPPKYETLNEAKTEKKINAATGRLAQHYKCNVCKDEFPATQIQVNHIEPVVPIEGFSDWNSFVKRLFCEKDKLEVLCRPCHKKITDKENTMRKEFKTKAEKATYQSWLDMKSRCFNQKSQRYYTHGDRGITVCSRWKDSFDSFKEDMGLKPDGFSIERIDNDGNYEPSNCKWATPKEQSYNRRSNVWISYNGDTLSLKQWADLLKMSQSALKKRLASMSIEEALTKEKDASKLRKRNA